MLFWAVVSSVAAVQLKLMLYAPEALPPKPVGATGGVLSTVYVALDTGEAVQPTRQPMAFIVVVVVLPLVEVIPKAELYMLPVVQLAAASQAGFAPFVV